MLFLCRYQGQISSIQQIFAEYDHNGSGKVGTAVWWTRSVLRLLQLLQALQVRVERVPDLIVNLGRDLQVGREAGGKMLCERAVSESSETAALAPGRSAA